MKTFIAGTNDSNQRLDKFLEKAMPALPKALMYKYLRTKHIKLNGKKAEISTRLAPGDRIDCFIKDEFFVQPDKKYSFKQAGKDIRIIYEDSNIMVLNKPAGLLSHPDEGEYGDTLITRVQRYLFEKNEYNPEEETSFAPALANRIDRNTSGIVLAAKNAEALRILNQKIKDREIQKLYLCIAVGEPEKREATLEGYIKKNEEKNIVRIYDKPVKDGKTVRTKYRVLKTANGLSLIEVDLLTGRTHQIRAHLASIGCPLLGDGKYGANEINKSFGGYKKQCLCSYKLRFCFTTAAGELEYLNGREFEISDVWFRTEFESLTEHLK